MEPSPSGATSPPVSQEAAREDERRERWRCYGAELIGTFGLVFGGVGAAVLAGEKIGPAGVALAFGFSLLMMVYAIGPISGCHVNPAVTVGLLLAGRMKPNRVLGYLVAQVVGAIIASLLILAIARALPGGYSPGAEGLGANGYGAHSPDGYALAGAFLAEVILTFFFVYVILAVTDPIAPVGFAGLAIGLSLSLVHLIGIPITNTSVNPARSLGPALLVGGWALAQLWMFIVAPLLGAAVAAAVYRLLRVPEKKITARRAEQSLERERIERISGREVYP